MTQDQVALYLVHLLLVWLGVTRIHMLPLVESLTVIQQGSVGRSPASRLFGQATRHRCLRLDLPLTFLWVLLL